MLTEKKHKSFKNGIVYALQTEAGFPIEVTDTFLPIYTRDAIGKHQNYLIDSKLGSRKERWMIGVSVSSGCPVGCKFCATGNLTSYYPLTCEEIVEQVEFVIGKHKEDRFEDAQEHKINYTRMGDAFLNLDNVRKAIGIIDSKYPNTHHYVSTIGIKGSDFSWIKDNITLQFSVHSLQNERRNWLIPFKNKMSLEQMGIVRTSSHLKTTINLTLVREEDFDIEALKNTFDPKYFFIKLSPINTNEISDKNMMGNGIIDGVNL